MFTGIVTATGTVTALHKSAREMDLSVDLGGLPRSLAVGDSVALSGVCCTLVRGVDGVGDFNLSEETLRRTWLGALKVGTRLNLEAALCAGEPFGGHIVQGHVDGVAEVVTPVDAERGGELWVRLPQELLPYCVEKGSIALDGVSLTLAGLDMDRAMIAVIPHTAEQTTLGARQPGDPLHVEVDVLAKYVERLLELRFGRGSAG